MADFNVLFDADGATISRPLWGTTQIPNQDIDPEHWEKFAEYRLDASIFYDTMSFILPATGSWIQSAANYSHEVVTSSSGVLTSTGSISSVYYSDANDAMGLKGITSDWMYTPDNRTFRQTYESLVDDATFAVYILFKPDDLNWEGRVYFGNHASPGGTSPGYYLSIKESIQVLYASYGGAYSEVARGSLFSSSSTAYSRLCILIHPSRDDRLYITNGYAAQTNKFFYRVPYNDVSKDELGELHPIIPAGRVGLYTYLTDALFVVEKYQFSGPAEVHSPVIQLPSAVDIDSVIERTQEYRLFGSSSISFGYSDLNANAQQAGWVTDNFRWMATLDTSDPNYTPEIYRVTLRQPADRSVSNNETDQASNTLAVNINFTEDLTTASGTLKLKENAAGDLESYSQRSLIPIRIKYKGSSILFGLSEGTQFEKKKLQSFGEVRINDFWKRLEYARMGELPAFDGMILTDVYEQVLRAAGLGKKSDGDPVPNFDIYTDGTVSLPLPKNDGNALFQPRPSTTVAEFLLDLRDNMSQDLMYFTPDGTLKIVRNWWAGIPGSSVPSYTQVFYMDTASTNAADDPYYTVRDFSQRVDDADFANVVYVIGYDENNDQPIIAVAKDYDSINDSSAPNYIGFEKEAWYFNSKLNTQEAVNAICLIMYEWLRTRRIIGTWKSAWSPDLKINDVVLFAGDDPTWEGNLASSEWRITGINVDISPSTLQRPTGAQQSKYWEATYTAVRVQPPGKTLGFKSD